MNTRKKATICLLLSGCAGFLFLSPPEQGASASGTPQRLRAVRVTAPLPLVESANKGAGGTAMPARSPEGPASSPVVPSLVPIIFGNPATKRPVEESRISEWASRDPEAAGHWLNQNRSHPGYEAMVRGYAIQLATIDPAAARQWAATLQDYGVPGIGNRFSQGGTLERHIDEIEAMLKGPDAGDASAGQAQKPRFIPDYTPALVRYHPDEEPVLVMRPQSIFYG